MQATILILGMAAGAEPDSAAPIAAPPRTHWTQAQYSTSATQTGQGAPMPGMNMGGMSMSGMDMSGMNMGGMDMGGMGMRMSPGEMAMGRMAFMNVMGSRADPGVIMKLLRGFEPSRGGMGSMNSMSGMGAMSGMSMDKKDSADVAAERAKLSPEDRRLVEAQELCPITKMQLGSMGPPIKLTLNGETVFLCCKNCVAEARANPEKTLAEVAKLKEQKAQDKTDMPGMAMGGTGGMNGMPMGGMNGMKQDRFSLSGWADMSYTASTANATNMPLGFNYLANRFLLQQNWLRLDYAVDEEATRPSFGFRSDWILPGTDYRFTLPRGLLNDQLTANGGAPNLYGIDPIHFYGEVYLPGILDGMDIKVGRFCMLHGIDMNEAAMNLLPSHSYTYLADPFTHTGILTTTRLSKQFLVQAAITTGSDVFFGPAAEPTFVGGFIWFSESGRTNLKFMTVLGSGAFNTAQMWDNRNIFDVVLRHQFGERLFYAAEGLFGYENNVPGIGSAQWYGAVQYLTYQINEKLAPTIRVELFDDPQGERTFFPGLYTAFSAGIYWRPRHWLTFRQEVRYDHNESGAFEGKNDLFTAASDLIFQW